MNDSFCYLWIHRLGYIPLLSHLHCIITSSWVYLPPKTRLISFRCHLFHLCTQNKNYILPSVWKALSKGLMKWMGWADKDGLVSAKYCICRRVCGGEGVGTVRAGPIIKTAPCVKSLLCFRKLCPLSLVFILPCKVNGDISRSYLLRAAECIISKDCKHFCDIKAGPWKYIYSN